MFLWFVFRGKWSFKLKKAIFAKLSELLGGVQLSRLAQSSISVDVGVYWTTWKAKRNVVLDNNNPYFCRTTRKGEFNSIILYITNQVPF